MNYNLCELGSGGAGTACTVVLDTMDHCSCRRAKTVVLSSLILELVALSKEPEQAAMSQGLGM